MAKGNAKFYGGGGETDDQHAFRDLIGVGKYEQLRPHTRCPFLLRPVQRIHTSQGRQAQIETDGMLDGVMLYDVMQQPKAPTGSLTEHMSQGWAGGYVTRRRSGTKGRSGCE
jgi:hypothetical protein